MARSSFIPLVLVLASCGGAAPVVDVLPPTDTTDVAGPYEVAVTIQDDGRIERAVVRWFVGDAAPRPLALVNESGTDRWTAQIPGQAAGAEVRFRVEVEDDEGQLVVAPAPTTDDPAPAYRFRVGPPSDSGE